MQSTICCALVAATEQYQSHAWGEFLFDMKGYVTLLNSVQESI